MTASSLPALTSWLTLACLLLLFVTAALVGRARVRYGIKAPATTGHDMFDRAYRVQMNTLENAVIFLPALWLCAWTAGDRWAAGLGAVWLAGRIWYAVAYQADPARRGNGFLMGFIAWAGLMLATVWGLARAWL
jgi:uncharacterized MAPEG superfamily protein